MRTITRTVELDATPQQVWEVLTAARAHAHWNPFITRMDGALEVGRRIEVRIAPPGGKPMTFRPTVTHVDPAHHLAWLGHLLLPGLFDGAHSFTLEPLPDNRTRLTQSETWKPRVACSAPMPDEHAGHEHFHCGCGKVFHSKQELTDHARRLNHRAA